MAVDTSSYAEAAGAPKTLADYNLQNQQVQQNALNMQRSRQQLDSYTQDQAEKASLRNYLSNSPDLSSASGYNGLMAAAPTLGPGIHKTYQESLTSAALAQKDLGSAAESNQKAKDMAFAHYQTQLGTVQSPEEAAQFISAAYNDPIVGPMLQQHGSLEDGLARLHQAVQSHGFDGWKSNATIGFQHIAEAAKVQNVDNGGSNQTQIVNPILGTAQTVSTATKTATPGEVLQANTSRNNNAANIAKDYKVAGLDANGNFSVATPGGASQPGAAKNPLDGLVDSIGTYGLKAETALARMPPAQKAYVMSAIAQKYPEYDPMSYTERQAGIHSFSPNGNNGKTVQALNVSVDHLAKFRDLATALDNGDNRLLNTVGNTISQWTGNPAPNNFEAAKNIVMDEVTKGVIGSAGGLGDREKMAGIVSKASSPADLAGAIDTITALMGGRLDGVQKSYESSTSRKDFATKYLTPQAKSALERANGSGSAPAPSAAIPTAPSGFVITHIDGKPHK